MPRGSSPGERRGGRKKGVPNKATIEARERAARELDAAKAGEKQIGKDVIEEMMFIAKGATASFQPVSEEQAQRAQAAGQTNVKPRAGDMEKFGQWWDRTVFAAKELAKYQSPTFRAIMVSTAGDAPKNDPKQIEGNVVPIDDPVGAGRVYRRIVMAGSRR